MSDTGVPGYPDCGTPLRTPHRAFTVGDERLCGHCWGEISGEQTFEMGRETVRIAGRNSDPAVAQTATGSTRTSGTSRRQD